MTTLISRSGMFKTSRPSILTLRCNVIRHSWKKDINTRSASQSKSEVPGHIGEEAAKSGKDLGETGPVLNHGTPVQDTMMNDARIKKQTSKFVSNDLDERPGLNTDIKNIIDQSSTQKNLTETFANLLALGRLENVSNNGQVEELDEMDANDPSVEGHKFGLPELPIPSDGNLKYRDDPLVQQVTNLLMKDGKKSVAQRNMSFILNALRTAPPPKFNPARLLIPGHPPAHHLPLDPIGYLTLAIDSIAPLLRIRSERGAAGGGAALQIPVPLGKKQRRRQAVMWILDSVNKRTNRSSGRGTFAQRFADEIISVVEGKSVTWEKRLMVHKTGTTARNNVNYRRRR